MGQRPKELTPHESPQHYWGAELRMWRNERKLSLADLGRRVHLNPSYLAKVERGERSPTRELVQDCDRALRAAGALARLHDHLITGSDPTVTGQIVETLHVANHPPHVANHVDLMALAEPQQAPWEVGEDVTIPARTPDGKVIMVSVPRRLFLQGLGGAAMGLAAGSTAPSTPTRLPSPDVALAHFERMRRTLADSDNLFGPHQVIPSVQQQFTLMQLMESPQGSLRPGWIRVQTEFADLAGWLHQDSGNHQAARYWMDRSLELAYQTGDPDDVVFMLTRKSQLALDMENPADAIGLAEAAMRLSRPRSRLAAISATFAGHGHALRGESGSSARAYDQARNLLASAEIDQAPWGQFFDTSYIAVWEAGSRALLGDYRAAAAEYHDAIATLPAGFRRDSGLYLAREARAYAGSEDVDQAVAVGHQALSIGLETGSGRILTELGNLDSTLSQWETPDVKQFHDELTAALPRQL